MLTRAEMEQTIIQGGSVLYKGRTITRVQDLPSEAELAEGNPEQEAAAAAALDAQIVALQAQRARLHQRGAAPAQAAATTAAADDGDDGDTKGAARKGK